MNHKVLLADDSLTIQKVIKITLANQPYDITDASSEEELFRKLPEIQPKIVFLDFNLSENFTGYELTTKIKSVVPTCKVLLLLGTFDTVDEAAMEKCGASDKIVKPFDSNKFIAICKHLIDTSGDEEMAMPAPIQSDSDKTGTFDLNAINEESDGWQIGHSISQVQETKKEEEPKLDGSFPNLNRLNQEISDWGMSVPGVINDKEPTLGKAIDLPPVIDLNEVRKNQELQANTQPTKEASSAKFPDNSDLDYPSIDDFASPAQEAKSPKYVSEANLIQLDSDPEPLQLEGNFTPDESDISSIEAQIKDEVEENLWQVDEFEDLKREVSSKIEEMNSTFDSNYAPVNHAEDHIQLEPASAVQSSGFSVSSDEVEALVKKHVQAFMDEHFRDVVEKVAWEVIPDLAENLIRQELSRISQKIMDEE